MAYRSYHPLLIRVDAGPATRAANMSLDIESFAALAASIIFTLVISLKPPRRRPEQLSLDIRDAEKRDENQAEYQRQLD